MPRSNPAPPYLKRFRTRRADTGRPLGRCETTAPAWLPNWEDRTKYPAPGNITLTQWAWEFLRRSPDYQAAFEKFVRPFMYMGDGAEWAAIEWARKQGAEYVGRSINADGSVTVINPQMLVAQRFGIVAPVPAPESDEPWFFALAHLSFTYCRPSPGETEITVKLDKNQIAIILDLSRPLEPQIERVRQVSERRFADIRTANHTNNFPIYLQLLDAEASGATQARMAAVVYRGRKVHLLARNMR